MSELFASLQTLMIDHIRLSLMNQIQHNKTNSITQLIMLALVVGVTSCIYDNFVGEKSFRTTYFDWRQYIMYKYSVTVEGKHLTGIDNYSRRPITIANTFSKNFRAILYTVMQKIDTVNDIRELKEFATNIIKGDDRGEEDVKTIFTVSQKVPFLLDTNREIYCIVKEFGEIKEEGSSKATETRLIRFGIHVFSYKSNVSVIKKFIHEMKCDYSKYLEDKRRGKLFVYTLNNTEVHNEDDDDTVGGWRETPHETMKSFDNIFFEGKKDVLQKIRFFTENKEWYRRNGVPYTLGIALYGSPGTGKTSFIKALAALLNRHIVSISLPRIKTKKQLHDFYFETQYNNANDKNTIGFDKKIIVFEDIDCVGDLVMSRKEKTLSDDILNIDSPDMDEIIPLSPTTQEIAKVTKYVLNKIHNDGKTSLLSPSTNHESITLDDLLNLWDGIRENTGRIMIITTNHYDKLDPALIRPGRIDIGLNLDNATRNTIAEMYLHYYGVEIDQNDVALIPDRYYSPAEVINFYVTNNDNPRGFVERLVSRKKI